MKLVFATNNLHKIREIQSILPAEIQIVGLSEIGCEEDIPETADTIEGNAILKAKYVKEKYGYNAFADDTGLEISVLNNAPGVYSARYAGEQKNDSDNVKLLLTNLKNQTDRTARFKTIIALCIDNECFTFEGVINGTITQSEKGENGFGYDPIFQPENSTLTFAQMTSEQKNKISHRKKATEKLVEFLNNLK